MMMRIVFPLIVFLLTARLAHAQRLPLTKFLSSARVDPSVTGFDDQLDWFDQKRYRLPLVNELELRTQNNVMINGRQQYRARLEFTSPWQIRENNSYFRQQRDLKEIRRRSALQEALRKRYLLAVRWLAARERLALLRDIEKLSVRRLEILEGLAGSDRFNPDSYVESRSDLVTRMVDRQEAEAFLALLETEMAVLARSPGGAPESPGKVILPETIAALSDTLSTRMDVTDWKAQIKAVELAEQKQKLDRTRLSFGWVQGLYAPYRAGTENHPTGFAVGVTIPVFQKNKDDVARSELNILEEKARLESGLLDRSVSQASRFAALRQQLRLYENASGWLDSLDITGLGPAHLVMRNSDPMSDIRHRIQKNRLELVRQEVKSRLLEQWIQLLDGLDLLAEEPWINFLSEDLKPLD